MWVRKQELDRLANDVAFWRIKYAELERQNRALVDTVFVNQNAPPPFRQAAPGPDQMVAHSSDREFLDRLEAAAEADARRAAEPAETEN